jgi:hypothetical protein
VGVHELVPAFVRKPDESPERPDIRRTGGISDVEVDRAASVLFNFPDQIVESGAGPAAGKCQIHRDVGVIAVDLADNRVHDSEDPVYSRLADHEEAKRFHAASFR